MLIRLLAKCKTGPTLDYQLVDILRKLSQYNCKTVLGRTWIVTELDLWTYPDGYAGKDAIKFLFPEPGVASDGLRAEVSGERLMERSALVHQFESGLFLRVVDTSAPVVIRPDLHLWNGPSHPQASNVDLEIRCDEACAYEVVTANKELIDTLRYGFAETWVTGADVP